MHNSFDLAGQLHQLQVPDSVLTVQLSLREERVRQNFRWVEWRVRKLTIEQGKHVDERGNLSIEQGKYVDERGKFLLEEKAAGGRKLRWGDDVANYAVWLLEVRDRLSHHQVAYRFFPSMTEQDSNKYVLKVRRARDRVERNHPGSRKFKPTPLSEYDNLLLRAVMFGAIPVPFSTTPAAPPLKSSQANIAAGQSERGNDEEAPRR